MFEFKAGTPLKIIADRTEWYSQNFINRPAKDDYLFDKEDMTIDPTGIADWCIGPQNKRVIGGSYAEAGYYGFKCQGFTILVHRSHVKYIG